MSQDTGPIEAGTGHGWSASPGSLDAFPVSQDTGPIEARVDAGPRLPHQHLVFPVSQDTGPIEADNRSTAGKTRPFPVSQDTGPIEAGASITGLLTFPRSGALPLVSQGTSPIQS